MRTAMVMMPNNGDDANGNGDRSGDGDADDNPRILLRISVAGVTGQVGNNIYLKI